MAFDMIEAMTLIAREKNLEFDAVLETLQASLLAAAKKKYPFTDNITFKFDRKNNELLMIAIKKVVETVEDDTIEVSLTEAKEIDEEAQLGDEIDIYIDFEVEFGRNAVQTAKQILIQKVREAERDRMYEEYIDKVGTLVSGVVQQIDKGSVIVNLGRGEGILPSKEQIPREKFRQGDRIRAYILDVQRSMRGPQVILSRVSNDFLKALFALEVPEIYERVIEIKAIAREPGERAKIAVYSSDERIDPVGACVGIKGVRVQSIVRELNNERIDIVPYATTPETFVSRALAPAKVIYVDVFELEQKMTVAVEDEKLSLAIGKNGMNARLASKLTGWKVNIMSETDYSNSKKREAELLVPVGQLDGIGERIRERLIEADISSVQRLASTPIETLVKIDGIGEKTAESLVAKAVAFAEKLEKEYAKKQKKIAKEEAKKAKVDEVKTADDMFVDDEEEYVTEVDEQSDVMAPDLDDVEEEEEIKIKHKEEEFVEDDDDNDK
jgi:N utilization substance protein A